MKEKIEKWDMSVKIRFSFLLIMIFLLVVQNTGGLKELSNEVEKLGRRITGYEEKIYSVERNGRSANALLAGLAFEQEMYFSEEMLENEQLMLGISVGSYQRINQGKLYVQIEQDAQYKVYEMEMKTVRKDGSLTLLLESSEWKEGNVKVKIYSPHATGANCLALYTVDNTKEYPGLIISGKTTEKNACINVMVPSVFAKSDFKEVGLEYSNQEYGYVERKILKEVEAFEIYLPESSSNKIYQISLHFLTYDRINTGILTIRFTQGRSVVTQEIDMSTIQNAQLMLFYLDGKHYDLGPCKVELFATGATEENCVATGVTKMTEYTDEKGNTPTYLVTDIYLLDKME